MALYICFCLTIMFHWWPDSCFQCVMMLCDSKYIMINCLLFHPTHCYFHFSHRVIHRGVTMGTNEESSLVPWWCVLYPLYTWCCTQKGWILYCDRTVLSFWCLCFPIFALPLFSKCVLIFLFLSLPIHSVPLFHSQYTFFYHPICNLKIIS